MVKLFKLFLLSLSLAAVFPVRAQEIKSNSFLVEPTAAGSPGGAGIGSVTFQDLSTGSVALIAPNSIGGVYSLMLPVPTGTAGCVEDSTGAGVLAIAPCGGLTPPVTISGSTTGTILAVTQTGTGGGVFITASSASQPALYVQQNSSAPALWAIGKVQFENGLILCGGVGCPTYDPYGVSIAVNTGFNAWAVNGSAGAGDTTILDYIGMEGDVFRIKGGETANSNADYFDWTRVKADNSGALPAHEVQFRDSSNNALIDYTNTSGTGGGGVFTMYGEVALGASTDIFSGANYRISNGSDYFELLNAGLGTHHLELQDSSSNDLLDYANTSGTGGGGVFTMYGEVALGASTDIFSGANYRISNGSDYFELLNAGLGTHHLELQDSSSNDLLDYANTSGTGGGGVFTMYGEVALGASTDIFSGANYRISNGSDYFELLNAGLGTHHLELQDSSSNDLLDYANTSGTGGGGVFTMYGEVALGASTDIFSGANYRISNGSDYFELLNAGLGTHHLELQDSSSNDLLDYANTSGTGGGGVFTMYGEVALGASTDIFSGANYRISNGSDYFELLNAGLGTHHLELQDSSSNDLLDYANSTGTWNDGTFGFAGLVTVSGPNATFNAYDKGGDGNFSAFYRSSDVTYIYDSSTSANLASLTTAGLFTALGGLAVDGTTVFNSSAFLNSAARIGTGTASSSTFLRGDLTWATPAGSGTVTSIATSSPITGGTITTTGTIGCSTCLTTSSSYVSSIAGTSNEVIASASTGAVTLSLPQAINTSAVPQFGGLLINQSNDSSGYLLQVNGGIEMANSSDAIFSKGIFEVSGSNAAYRTYDQSGGGSYAALYRTGGNITYLYDSVLAGNAFGVNDSGEGFFLAGVTVNGSAGVSCAAGAISLLTEVVTGGVVTHC